MRAAGQATSGKRGAAAAQPRRHASRGGRPGGLPLRGSRACTDNVRQGEATREARGRGAQQKSFDG